MFRGHHHLTVDDKGRLAIPAALRQKLETGDGIPLILTMAVSPCLELYETKVFDDLAARIAQIQDSERRTMLRRAWVGRAAEVEIDKQGRITLPQALRTDAHLNGAVVLVGQIDRFEIWPEERWNAQFREGPDSQLPALIEAFRAFDR